MRCLIYKRTHNGDPSASGTFGVFDCMGRVRSLTYDAVIGVGGVGRQPKSLGIDAKVNWIGIGPHKARQPGLRGPIVTFDHFLGLGANGPPVALVAPRVAERLYGRRARYILAPRGPEEEQEVEGIVAWAIAAASSTPSGSAQCGRAVRQGGLGTSPRVCGVRNVPRRRCRTGPRLTRPRW
jgi:hypothetical protein